MVEQCKTVNYPKVNQGIYKCCHVVKQTGLLTKYKSTSLIWDRIIDILKIVLLLASKDEPIRQLKLVRM